MLQLGLAGPAPGIPSLDPNLVQGFLKMLNTYLHIRNGIPRASDTDAKSPSAKQRTIIAREG